MYKTVTVLILVLFLLAGCTAAPTPSVPATAPSGAATTAPLDTAPASQAATSAAAESTQVTQAPTEAATEPSETSAAAETTQVTQAPTEAATEPSETSAPTEPEHSELYIPHVPAEDMVTYFLEVCLDAEFVHSGNAHVLQRWEAPIYYQLHGDPTDEDLQIIRRMVQWLNEQEGFPGMWEADDDRWPNLNIYFCSQQELIDRMGDDFWGMDGAFTFWYSNDIIYDCTICIRNDLDQYLRNSVIQEEIYNALGPAQDTDLRQESIIYSGFSQPQALHPIDEVILQLLYHPSLKCGMDAAECRDAILNLYY